MKPTFLIIFLLAFLGGFAQTKKDSSAGVFVFIDKPKIIDSNYIRIYHSKANPDTGLPPAYYIDSVRVQSLPNFNPKDILDIKIHSGIDSISKTNGKIFIALKKHSYHFISIEELTKRCIPNFDSKSQAVIYLLNDKLISDTTDMKFEITYIRSVEVTDGSQIKAFKGILSGVIVLKIYTGDASDTSIYIR